MTKNQKLGLGLGLGLALPSAIAIAVATPLLVKKYNNKSPQARIEKLEKDLKKSALAPILQAEKDILRLKIEEIIKTNDLLSKHQVATLKSKEFQEALDEVIDANALKVSYIFKTLGLDESDVVSFYRTIYNDKEFKDTPKFSDILISKFMSISLDSIKHPTYILRNVFGTTLKKELKEKISNHIDLYYLTKILKTNKLFKLYEQSNLSKDKNSILINKILEIIESENKFFINFDEVDTFIWGGDFSLHELLGDSNGKPTEIDIRNSKEYVKDQKQEFDKNLEVDKTTKLGSKFIDWLLYQFRNYPDSYTRDKNLNKLEDFEYYPIAKKINNYARKIFGLFEIQNKKLDFELKTETYITEITIKFINYLNSLLKLKTEGKIDELNSQVKMLKAKITYFDELKYFYKEGDNLDLQIKQLFNQKYNEVEIKIKELDLKLGD